MCVVMSADAHGDATSRRNTTTTKKATTSWHTTRTLRHAKGSTRPFTHIHNTPCTHARTACGPNAKAREQRGGRFICCRVVEAQVITPSRLRQWLPADGGVAYDAGPRQAPAGATTRTFATRCPACAVGGQVLLGHHLRGRNFSTAC